MQPRGFFITFEGSEACGKTTQIRRLADHLRQLSHSVLLTREPGGTAIGEEIRQLLQFSKAGYGMMPETELLLFAASRAQLVREVIEPALQGGAIVIADRFWDSTTVYQGVARRLDPAAVQFVNQFAVGACHPDVTFVLDLDPRLARQRMALRPVSPGAPPDRMEQQPEDFYEAVRAGYLALAAQNPERLCVIDGAQSVEEIEQEIRRHLSLRLGF